MTIEKRAAGWLRDRGPFLAAALLLAASLPMEAQDRSRSRPNDSSGREAVPRASAPSSGSNSGSWSRPEPSTPEPPRTARPSTGDREPERQRPRGDGDRDHGSHGGGGWHGGRGGYYGGYYDPYWRWGWGWGWWGPYYGPYYGPSVYDYPRRGYGRDLGALDLDVSPARTQVFLDGQYIGTVDQFDGWPQYLWLDKGTYDLVFYLDGFKTVARQVSVYPGVVADFNDRLEPGESVRPEALASTSTERRDARLRTEREPAERTDRWASDPDWRERVRRGREARRDTGDAGGEETESRDARAEPGRVRLKIEPDDASVYLDGRFLGTGTELAELHAGLLVDPGEHRLAVVRPGHQSHEMDFEVEAGEEVELEVELEKTR